jgi:hypothetical protein
MTALDAIWELNLDVWDLPVGVQVFELLRDVGNGRTEAAVAAFHLLRLEAFGDLLDEGYLLASSKK